MAYTIGPDMVPQSFWTATRWYPLGTAHVWWTAWATYAPLPVPRYGVAYAAADDVSLFHITSWGRHAVLFCPPVTPYHCCPCNPYLLPVMVY